MQFGGKQTRLMTQYDYRRQAAWFFKACLQRPHAPPYFVAGGLQSDELYSVAHSVHILLSNWQQRRAACATTSFNVYSFPNTHREAPSEAEILPKLLPQLYPRQQCTSLSLTPGQENLLRRTAHCPLLHMVLII